MFEQQFSYISKSKKNRLLSFSLRKPKVVTDGPGPKLEGGNITVGGGVHGVVHVVHSHPTVDSFTDHQEHGIEPGTRLRKIYLRTLVPGHT